MSSKKISSKMIAQMSKQSLKSSRMRNIFVMITIVLASALLMAILMYAVGQRETNERQLSHAQQVSYYNLTDSQVETLKNDERIAYQIQMKSGTTSKVGNISITRHEAQVEKAMMAKVRAWENVFGLSAEQSRNLGQLFLRKSLAAGELASAESGLLKIIAGVKENSLIDWPTAQKIILHQYRKAVRRQPNPQNVRRMLKSPLCRELGVSTFFRAEKYIGSFFKRERKRL